MEQWEMEKPMTLLWLAFTNVNGLTINGSGTINGRGSAWWPQPCLHKVAKALTFYRCNRLVLKGLRHINSQRNHITLTNCKGATISNLHISAPATSPNTDGIDIGGSSNVQIRNSFISTGDDCIAVSSGSSHINITGISCGPGHGISIGALGVHGENDTVEEVHVRNCTFKGTMTGVRIKTWQGGVGYARKISFDKIKFIRVDSPIIIDQYYCPSGENCRNETSAIKISDVSYKSIVGTSITDKVINLSCDQNVGCSNIQLDHVYIKSMVPGKKAYSYCFNAHGKYTHTRPVADCLKP
ncbi:Glycoside hydrolase, family 28 [Corchorus capsularis]|uniref:Glycoside hydrolase, family 28 n=1 Tax=Corchorus capsularis TaxID=210143 RepID=A0A1R3G8A0_COCAP|nr:Glycoside hydrolase, family 28 [Corchorus capsularis]